MNDKISFETNSDLFWIKRNIFKKVDYKKKYKNKTLWGLATFNLANYILNFFFNISTRNNIWLLFTYLIINSSIIFIIPVFGWVLEKLQIYSIKQIKTRINTNLHKPSVESAYVSYCARNKGNRRDIFKKFVKNFFPNFLKTNVLTEDFLNIVYNELISE